MAVSLLIRFLLNPIVIAEVFQESKIENSTLIIYWLLRNLIS